MTASAENSDLGTLYTMRADDGTEMTKVYDGPIATTSATWQPTGG